MGNQEFSKRAGSYVDVKLSPEPAETDQFNWDDCLYQPSWMPSKPSSGERAGRP
jgi:hypothetical protein